MSKATVDKLDQLHNMVAQTLIEKLESGEAGAADINAAIKFLQNNGIEANITPESPLATLRTALPKFNDEEYDSIN